MTAFTFNQVLLNREIKACICLQFYSGLTVLQQCIKYSFIIPGVVISGSLGFRVALLSLSWVLQRQLSWDDHSVLQNIPNLICPMEGSKDDPIPEMASGGATSISDDIILFHCCFKIRQTQAVRVAGNPLKLT